MFLLMACMTSGFGDDTGDSSDKNGVNGNLGVGGTTGEDLPDIREDMDASAGNCQTLNGDALFGANSYFWGLFEGNDQDGWEGEERWYLFANNTAKDGGFNDCVVTWMASASPITPSGCPTCEVGMVISAQLTDNTCSDDLSVEQSYSVDYAVHTADNGDSLWYFPSGTQFGKGYWNGGALSYLTEASCRWF